MLKQPEASRRIASFGRRHGRRLHPQAKRLVTELLPQLQISLPDGVIDPVSLFPKARSVRLEIGCGAGEFIAAQARAHPDIDFIGCEPYMNGVAKLLAIIEQENLRNIRLFTDDARLLLDRLPDVSLEQVYILFPDPWPKQRHHKRRLISLELLALLARLQPEGGRLLLATDHADYSAWMLEALMQQHDYRWTAGSAADFTLPPPEWIATRYQYKTSAEGREPVFLSCLRD